MPEREQRRLVRERAVAHESRVALLEELRGADGPLDAAELAERVGLHVNTVRSHLGLLVEAGLVRRAPEPREEPGRPRVLYSPGEPSAGDAMERYRLMARMLASYIATNVEDPAAAAEETGREWGRHMTEDPPPFTRPSVDEARARLVALLDELGFAPSEGPAASEIQLRQCPFRDVAEAHPEVACSLHLGLMRGAMARIGAPITVEQLIPFVAPDRCTTVVSWREDRR